MKKRYDIFISEFWLSLAEIAIMITIEFFIYNLCIDQINTSLDNVCRTTYTVQGDGKTVIEDLINATPDTINSIVSAIGCSIFWGGLVLGVVYNRLQYILGKNSTTMKIIDEIFDFANGLLGVFALIGTYITLITNVSDLTINSVQSEISIPVFIFSLCCFSAITGRSVVRILDVIIDMLEERRGWIYAALAIAIGLVCVINFYYY